MDHTERDVTLRQLRTFLCVARAGNFSRAAAELGISQPAVSDQIAMLEGRLGHALFRRRTGTTPLLTIEGTQLLEKAGNVLDTAKAMRREEGRHVRQTVRVSIGPWLRETYLKPLLPRLYREPPCVTVESVPIVASDQVRSALENGRVDLIVYTVGKIEPDWPNARIVNQVPIVMVAAPDLAARLRSGAARLEDQQFFLPSSPYIRGNWIENQLDRLGVRQRLPTVYLEFPEVVQELIEEGQGVSVLMRAQVAGSLAAGRLAVIGSKLPPMHRIIARSDRAPEGACIVEERICAAMHANEAAL